MDFLLLFESRKFLKSAKASDFSRTTVSIRMVSRVIHIQGIYDSIQGYICPLLERTYLISYSHICLNHINCMTVYNLQSVISISRPSKLYTQAVSAQTSTKTSSTRYWGSVAPPGKIRTNIALGKRQRKIEEISQDLSNRLRKNREGYLAHPTGASVRQ